MKEAVLALTTRPPFRSDTHEAVCALALLACVSSPCSTPSVQVTNACRDLSHAPLFSFLRTHACCLICGGGGASADALTVRKLDARSLAPCSTRSVLPLVGGRGLASLSVSVLYLSCQMSQCSHSASALTGSPLGLESPIVASDLARGMASGSASLLLLVPVLSARVATERMRLVATFSLSLSSLRL